VPEGVVLIKRVCGHSSPFTFKKNERFGKERLEKFLSKKCPLCTQAAIQALEAKQAAESQRLKQVRQRIQSKAKGSADPAAPPELPPDN
jgi:hypothetical protein